MTFYDSSRHFMTFHVIKLYNMTQHDMTFQDISITSHHITSHHITSHDITSHHMVSYHSSKLYDRRGFVRIVRRHFLFFKFVKLHLSLPAFCTINTGEKRQIIEAQLS